jgi:soluble lytic murein transglycosylase-like protein
VARQESGFDPRAVSSAGAQGVMQLMPTTAQALGVKDPFDPAQSVAGGARLLKQLLTRYNGNTDLALAAYNAGPGAVDAHGGVPPFPETQQYVSRIKARLGAQPATPAPAGGSRGVFNPLTGQIDWGS